MRLVYLHPSSAMENCQKKEPLLSLGLQKGGMCVVHASEV